MTFVNDTTNTEAGSRDQLCGESVRVKMESVGHQGESRRITTYHSVLPLLFNVYYLVFRPKTPAPQALLQQLTASRLYGATFILLPRVQTAAEVAASAPDSPAPTMHLGSSELEREPHVASVRPYHVLPGPSSMQSHQREHRTIILISSLHRRLVP
jgi:hypothetical protein